MDLELADKVALITGASRGIGRAIAEGLAYADIEVQRTVGGGETVLERSR